MKNTMEQFVLLRHGSIVTVGGPEADFPGYTSADIQAAVDRAARSGGGTVLLGKGTFEMRGPVRLQDGITLQGHGEETVLRKSDGFRAGLVTDADYGEIRVDVDDVSGFRVGTGIQLFDEDQWMSWAETTAVITAIEGNTLYFDRYSVRDYSADRGGTVTNACSVIEAVEVKHAVISNLAIDGNKRTNNRIGGCRAGAVYIHKASHVTVDGVKVSDFNGDGISWQITEDITISRCETSGCAGAGLHPGTGSLRSVVRDCRSHHHAGDGIYICWRVKHGRFAGNEFYANGSSGISIGHKDTDNRFEGNRIYGNAHSGVYFRKEKESNGAHRNVFIGNIIEDNGDEAGNGFGIYVNGCTRDTVIEGNTIRDTGKNVQNTAVYLGEDTPGTRMTGHLP